MAKIEVESCLKLSTKELKRLGLLTGDWLGERTISWTTPSGVKIGSVKVCAKPIGRSAIDNDPCGCIEITDTRRDYQTNILTHYTYAVGLTTTDCNYGEYSLHYWFLCPLCNKRVGTIYRPPGKYYFGCRHCYNLSYASRNVSRGVWDRLLGMWLKSGGKREDW